MTTITLKHPIKRDDGSDLKEIDLRRLTVADMKAMHGAKNSLEGSIIALSRAGSLSPDEIDRMDAADYNAMDEVLAGFMYHHGGEN